ncbi:glutathione S-transferase family protein [Flexibacterium corallicola]|uniref:glutathione S-transferase family protein n=1 Tax=Flexibacterium corallicola TaxID=3037259 RepID=UPI00286F41E1|nr:glutathione S-transferase [Pseudovibrio sp. M1P-2-3]
MITLHHLENSQSIRILWLLEELGAEYDLKKYKRDETTSLAPQEYKHLHSVGTAPIITEGDLVLPETNAIVDYILDKYPNKTLRPEAGTENRALYLYWFHACQGSLTPLLLDTLIFNRMETKPPFFMRPIIKAVTSKVRALFLEPRLNGMLAHIEDQLGRTKWIAGNELTAADIVLAYSLEVAHVRLGLTDKYPNIKGYISQVNERPAYKTALEKGGEFNPLRG